MPAVYIGTMMDSGHVKWRPRFSSGLSDEGPDDRRLIINFRGTLSRIPWITATSYGYAVNLEILSDSVPELFDKNWLRGQGIKKAIISKTDDYYTIDIQI